MFQLPIARTHVRSIASALVACTVCLPLSAAPQQWLDQFGTPGSDSLDAVEPAGAGAVFLIGWTGGALAGPSVGGSDVFVQKRDVDGNLLWQRQYGSSGGETNMSAAGDGAGGLFIAGSTSGDFGGPPAGVTDAFLLHLDGAGDVLWVSKVATPVMEGPAFVISDGNGGAILGGSMLGESGAPDDSDAWIARFDASGALLWSSQFGTAAADGLSGAALDGVGGLFLGGSTDGDLGGANAGNQDAFYGHMDLSGTAPMIVQFGTPDYDGVTDVLSDGAGGAYLAGQTNGPLFGSNPWPMDVFLIHVDANMAITWSTQFTADDNVSQPSLALDGSGGLFVAGAWSGSMTSSASGLFDPMVARVDSAGTFVDMLTLPGVGIDNALDVVADGAGGLIVVGYTEYGLFEFQPGNNLQAWVGRFGPCDFDTPTTYCVAAPNSTGVGASISNSGSRYVDNNDFTLAVDDCPSGQIGIFLMASNQASVPFGNGTLCVGGSVSRLLPAQVTSAAGAASLQLDFGDPNSPASMITPASTWNFQFCYRDPAAGGSGFNLSN
ncbi:MAG TPA: hypothetical protein VMT18_03230, partial [Planctomycetota bacterium]|nr:hypothetical protein [Planctomycetota bacterium]